MQQAYPPTWNHIWLIVMEYAFNKRWPDIRDSVRSHCHDLSNVWACLLIGFKSHGSLGAEPCLLCMHLHRCQLMFEKLSTGNGYKMHLPTRLTRYRQQLLKYVRYNVASDMSHQCLHLVSTLKLTVAIIQLATSWNIDELPEVRLSAVSTVVHLK